MSPRAAWRLEGLGYGEVYDYPGGKQDWFAAGLSAEGNRPDADRLASHAEHVVTCSLEERVSDVLARIRESDWGFAVTVSEGNAVLGRLRRSDAENAGDAMVREVMHEGPSTFRPNVPVHEMGEYMRLHDVSTAIVTTSQGILVGAVPRSALEAATR